MSAASIQSLPRHSIQDHCSAGERIHVHRRRPVPQEASIPMLLAALLRVIGPSLDRQGRAELARDLLSPGRKGHVPPPEMSVAKLCLLYMRHARTYYLKTNGGRTSEADPIRYALQPLRHLFGRQPVSEFGPLRLKRVQEEMVAAGWYRKTVNQQVGRIKRMFKWAVSNELIPADVYHALQAVDGLRMGRTTAPESKPVKPVPEPLIEAILPRLSSQVQAMIRLQLLTGMRSGEVVIMRTCDVETSDQPWVYRPEHHKTEHYDHERIVFLGPKCQEIIRPFLRTEHPQQYLFSPADADRERRDRLHALRKTPMSCGNVPGSHRQSRPRRPPGDLYDPQSYGRAIARACEIAFPVPGSLPPAQKGQWCREHHWHPHQLRHNAATRLRKEYGLEVAQVVLGHKTLAMTQVYAEKDQETAREVMLSAG